MQHLVDAYHLALDPAAPALARPRLGHLLLGAGCLLAAFVLHADAGPVFWDVATLGDPRLAAWGLLLAGAWLLARALRSDFLHLHQVSFTKQALHLHWSHVPSLWSGRRMHSQALVWADLADCQWVEGENEHDLRQYLQVRLKHPLGRHTDQLRVLLCHGRRTLHCERLLAFLPDGLVAPDWLQAERKRGTGHAHEE